MEEGDGVLVQLEEAEQLELEHLGGDRGPIHKAKFWLENWLEITF